MRNAVIAAVAVLAVFLSSCSAPKEGKENRPKPNITKERAETIARAEARRMGFDVTPMNMEVFRDEMPWYAHHPSMKKYFDTSEYYKGVRNKLEGRDYWAVYYSRDVTGPEQAFHKGDICVFVDSASGEVITVYLGPAESTSP